MDVLSPKMMMTFDALSVTNISTGHMLDAHITVLPREDNVTQVSNYRPISLLNVDIKLYAKILANRLLPLLPNLISLDQVGFVPGREARDNTLRALNIHHWLTSSKTSGGFCHWTRRRCLTEWTGTTCGRLWQRRDFNRACWLMSWHYTLALLCV